MAEVDINRNGDSQDTLQIGNDTIKVLVVGDAGCGKSTFLNKFLGNGLSNDVFVNHGATVNLYYGYDHGELKKYAFIEIPAVPNVDDILEHYSDASGCIFMYAVGDPSSFDHLDQWVTRVGVYLALPGIMKIVVGHKYDQFNNQQLIQQLAFQNRAPITAEQGQEFVQQHNLNSFFASCHHDSGSVKEAFDYIFDNAVLIQHV